MRSDDEAPRVTLERAEPALEVASNPTAEASGSSQEMPLLPKGNAFRSKPLLWALLGALPAGLLMACDRHFAFSVPLGGAGLLIASFALLDAWGTFDDRVVRASGEPPSSRAILRRLLEFGLALVASSYALRLAVAGALPRPVLSSGVLVSVGAIALIVAGCRVAEALSIFDREGPAWHARRGFWLVISNVLLYVPLLGSYSLSDPWEAHYGEVAREMLARDDWLSTWWAQDGWFWSKPVLDFWLQGLSFSVSGVHFMPDQMLASASVGLSPAPEWAARLPIFFLTVLGTYFLYKAVARVFGTRAGFLAGLVLTTAPYWYLIAHQSMTDMPYVAPLTAALALIALGLQSGPETRIRSYPLRVGKRVLGLSAFHLLFGCILLTVLPQLLYLMTRNVTLQLSPAHFGFRFHGDEFFSGSGGGNCGLPGNEPCRWAEPVNRVFQPALGALVWGAALGMLLYVNRGERRAQRLYFLAAWYFTALSALAKGAPGLVLPVVIALAALGAFRRYRDFSRLELVGLCLIIGCVCLPWYVQMYMRHGPPFTDRLLFHDMYKRAFVHVHDTNTGDDVSFRYYVWQLGYGLFPWSGFGAAGLLWWLRFKNETVQPQAQQMAFMALWFTIAFAMFTITLTKFHHYALPTVPPIAAVSGVMLDRAFGPPKHHRSSLLVRCYSYFGCLGASAVLALYGATILFHGTLSGRLPVAHSFVSSGWFGMALLGASASLAFVASRSERETMSDPSTSSPGLAYESAMLSLLGVAAAATLVLVGRDLSSSVSGDVEGQARLMHLFTYNYRRAWPSDSLDFNGVLRAFTACFAICSVAFAWPRWRRQALWSFLLLAGTWTAWGLDVYLVEAAPHWGQRETILAYYAARKGPEEPFIAYQMNWKGENFYTGNRVPAFVSSGAKFKNWIADQKKHGVKAMFFTTEHSRIGLLKGELGTLKDFKQLTSRELNNKFALVRAEF